MQTLRLAEICVHGTGTLHMSLLAGVVPAAREADPFHLTLFLHDTVVAADLSLDGAGTAKKTRYCNIQD